MGPGIELAEVADVPRLLEIRHAAFSAQAPAAYSAEEVETLLGDIDEGELREMIATRQLFVARHDGRVVGLAGWKGTRLRHVYVDPARTRRRIATALLAQVEADYLVRSGRTEIRADVALHAETFYRASGYRLIRRAIAWDGSTYLRMTRTLAASAALPSPPLS